MQRKTPCFVRKDAAKPILERLDNELSLADKGNISSTYMLLYHLSAHLRENGGQIGIRGTLGSTLISFLLGITDINPLPAHYHCSNCGYVKFTAKDSGYDLPQDTCPNCDTLLRGDGHEIPYEACLDFVRGKPTETVDINVSTSIWEKAVDFFVKFLGEDQIAVACEWNNPVCFMLLPESMKFEDITPNTELYHQADVLLIDNLQYISGKVASQEELFNILDRRLLQNKQIVFVGDNDLERIPGLGIEL